MLFYSFYLHFVLFLPEMTAIVTVKILFLLCVFTTVKLKEIAFGTRNTIIWFLNNLTKEPIIKFKIHVWIDIFSCWFGWFKSCISIINYLRTYISLNVLKI